MSDPCDQMNHYYDLLTNELRRRAPFAGVFPSAVPGMEIICRDVPERIENVLYRSCICIVAQGHKLASIGTENYTYGRGQYILNCVEMPSAIRIGINADAPFLALAVGLDPRLLAQIFRELDEGRESASSEPADESSGHFGPEKSIRIGDVTPELLDAFLRLARIADDEERARFVAPLIVREIHYYLASGPHGNYLRAFYMSSSQSGQIARAVAFMREHCSERLRIESLARMVNMAESTFNRNFKKVTSLSPLQYHKHLKLHEARRLMAVENMSAAAACFAVGYESQQQFTREYKRLFGRPPMKDVRRNSA